MSPGHQVWDHPTFPLSNSTVPKEVIAVHQGQLVQEELNGALAPSYLRTLALGRTQGEHWVNLPLACWHWNTWRPFLPAPASFWWAARGCAEPGSPDECRRPTRSSRSGWSFRCSSLSNKSLWVIISWQFLSTFSLFQTEISNIHIKW